VAFFEHQVELDDRGWLKVVDRSGAVKTLAGEYWGMEGLAWTQDGQALLYSASAGGGGNYHPYRIAASGTGQPRRAVASAGSLWVQDVNKDGRTILLGMDPVSSIRLRVPGSDQERELNWLNETDYPHLSRDGSRLLFTDLSVGAGDNYATAYRDTSGGQPVRLGEGISGGFSPDGAWALAIVPTPPQLALYPFGPGDPVRLERGAIEGYQQASWFPDGKHVLFCGNQHSKPLRCYRQAVDGGPPSPVTPDGVVNAVVAPDGRTLATVSTSGDWQITTIDAGSARAAVGLTRADLPIAWANDGRSLFVQAGRTVPGRIERVDPVTGQRTLVREIAPPDRSGLVGVGPVSIIGDGAGYAYRYSKRAMTLYSVQGIK
jgi:Tol biopolymer transport system component